MTKPTAPTPTRKTPRISVQSKGRISLGRKLPINPCMVLNVSAGGALLFAEKPVEEGTVMQVELGAPIFPVPRLISVTVKHLERASNAVLAALVEKGRIAEKTKGYLLGVEFVRLDEEQRGTLTKFIQSHIRDEQRRRAARGTDGQVHTALDRTIHVERPAVPGWVYSIGLVIGAFEIITGIMQGQSDVDIAWHAGVPMAVIWAVARISVELLGRLAPETPPDAEIVAETDDSATGIDDILSDADSLLDKLPAEEEAQGEDDPSLISSGEEVVKAGTTSIAIV